MGCDGSERWQLKRAQGPACAELLPGPRVLLSETLVNSVSERDLDGKVLWEFNISTFLPVPRWRVGYCKRLPNGDTFTAVGDGAIEVTPEHELVFVHKNYSDVYSDILSANATLKLPNRRVLCDCKGSGARRFLTEAEPSTGKVLKRVELFPTGFVGNNGSSCVQALAGGHYLLMERRPIGRLAELNAAGQTIWHHTMKTSAYYAMRLRNGNTLVAMDPHRPVYGVAIHEIDSKGRVKWEGFAAEAVVRIEPCYSLCSLGFGVSLSEQTRPCQRPSVSPRPRGPRASASSRQGSVCFG
jgi:hypothetical protein